MKKNCINCQKPIKSKEQLHCPGCDFGPLCNTCYKDFSHPIIEAQGEILETLLEMTKKFSNIATEIEKLQSILKNIMLNDE